MPCFLSFRAPLALAPQGEGGPRGSCRGLRLQALQVDPHYGPRARHRPVRPHDPVPWSFKARPLTSSPFVSLACRFLELCVSMRKSKVAKEGLGVYRYVCLCSRSRLALKRLTVFSLFAEMSPRRPTSPPSRLSSESSSLPLTPRSSRPRSPPLSCSPPTEPTSPPRTRRRSTSMPLWTPLPFS